MTTGQVILMFLGLPFLTGLAVPFLGAKPIAKRALWLTALLLSASVTYVWATSTDGQANLLNSILASTAVMAWIISGLLGLLVGREAAHVRRDAKNTIEQRKAAEIFR